MRLRSLALRGLALTALLLLVLAVTGRFEWGEHFVSATWGETHRDCVELTVWHEADGWHAGVCYWWHARGDLLAGADPYAQ